MNDSPKKAPAQFLFAPVDIAWLAILRVAFGLCAFADVVMNFADGRWFHSPMHFSYPGFEWITAWPGFGMKIHLAVLGLLALAVAAGFLYRLCAALFFAGYAFLFLCDASQYRDDTYLICLLAALMAVLPAHRAASLDVRAGRVAPMDSVPAWMLWLLRFQIAIVYVFSDIAHLNADWLAGLPVKFWLADCANIHLIGPVLARDWMVPVVVYGVIFFYLLITPLLFWRPTRLIAFIVACGFHFTSALTFSTAIFPCVMIVGTMVFFDPAWPRRTGWLGRKENDTGGVHAAKAAPVLLLLVYAVLQIALPLRHWRFPGDVQWTDEGRNFSWSMNLRSKFATAVLYVTDPKEKTTRGIMLSDELPPALSRYVASRPLLFAQFARHIADTEAAKAGGRPEVRARVLCSLNGRMPRLLVDTNMDFAAMPRPQAPWILSLTNAPVGGGSSSELDSIQADLRKVRQEMADIQNVIAVTGKQMEGLDRGLRESASGTDQQTAVRTALLNRKQTLGQRLQVMTQLYRDKEKARTVLLENLQDCLMAGSEVVPVSQAD